MKIIRRALCAFAAAMRAIGDAPRALADIEQEEVAHKMRGE